MGWSAKILPVLLVIVIVESAIIALPYINRGSGTRELIPGKTQSVSFPYQVFNQPISNDSDVRLSPAYDSSWLVTVRSSLSSAGGESSEAQLALAPVYTSENLSIPTIIVQERADGLLRVEYYAQNWPNTYGLVLWNSTSPSWAGGQNITLRFVSFGAPSAVNPALAPRPNGNLTIALGSTVLVSDYPIAWASLGEVYVYGLSGSSFAGGSVQLYFQSLYRG